MYKYISLCLVLIAAALTNCTIPDQVDPNNPSINSVLKDATQTELNLLVTGIEAQARAGYGEYITATGSVSRELYLFDADPRNTADLLGKGGIPIDNNTFYLTAPYGNAYRGIKACNILLDALANTSEVTEAQKKGYEAFAKTMKALLLQRPLNMLYNNGIRVDVANPGNLGPFLARAEAQQEIRKLLDEAFAQLSGAQFAFQLSNGFSGYNDPGGFGEFNRALAARAAIYAEDWNGALTALNASFFQENGDMTMGPKHIFSFSSGDILNPLFKTPNQSGDQIIVHDEFITEAEAGDRRVAEKTAPRLNASSQDGLNGTHETRLYASNVSPIDIIRNEELVLIYAEVLIQTNQPDDAATALNRVRSNAGLGPYTGGLSKDELIDELLKQRRYSLWSEGHRMVDLRRYGRLNDAHVPIDRPGDVIYTQFPVPLTDI